MSTVSASERVRLDIEGMTCASCAARIEKKLNKLDGVEATVNYATEEAAVSFDPARVQLEKLIRTGEATGYGAAGARSGVEARRADEPDDALRMIRRRLALAAVLTAPLTLLALVPPVQFSCWGWLFVALAAPVGHLCRSVGDH